MNHERVEKLRAKLDNLTISDYHGLNSPGLTCYLNSVLQVLFMTEDFRGSIKRLCSEDSTAIDTLLRNLFDDLERDVSETHSLTKQLGITDVYKQRDAAEYFEKILCQTSPGASKIFKGELNHKITCVTCQKRKDSKVLFWILPLAMENGGKYGQTYSVERGLKAFFRKENIPGENKMYCNQCNTKRDAEMDCEMTQKPEILSLLLKRFTYDHECKCFIKLHCEVDVPQTLHMESCRYDLYAVVNHFGNLTGGHYTAEIKSFEVGEWYCFNNDIVERVRQPPFWPGNTSMRSRTAYLLMFRKEPKTRGRSWLSPKSNFSNMQKDGRQQHPETSSAQMKDDCVFNTFQRKRQQLEDDAWDGTGRDGTAVGQPLEQAQMKEGKQQRERESESVQVETTQTVTKGQKTLSQRKMKNTRGGDTVDILI